MHQYVLCIKIQMQLDFSKMMNLLAKKQYDTFIAEYQIIVQDQQSHSTSMFKNISLQYQKITNLIKKIDDYLKYLKQPNQGWIVNQLKQQSYVAVNRKQHTIEAKYQIILQKGLLNLCKLLSLTSAYKDILPFCYYSQDVNKISPLEKDVLIKFKIPFINKRNLVLHIAAIDRIDKNNTIVIHGQGLDKDQAKKLVKNLKGDYMNLKNFICEIKIDQGYYTISSYAIINNNIGYIPDWVIGRLLQIIGSFLIDRFANYITKQPNQKQQQKYVKQKNQFNICMQKRLEIRNKINAKL